MEENDDGNFLVSIFFTNGVAKRRRGIRTSFRDDGGFRLKIGDIVFLRMMLMILFLRIVRVRIMRICMDTRMFEDVCFLGNRSYGRTIANRIRDGITISVGTGREDEQEGEDEDGGENTDAIPSRVRADGLAEMADLELAEGSILRSHLGVEMTTGGRMNERVAVPGEIE